jgi:3-deoxy-manno-octulosonate cytidylyltransferase (CMP-KDO synthetase)
MKLLIAIPARYASTRFPGKPLAPILGKPMLQRVYEIAIKASSLYTNVDCVVATEDQRIMDFCKTNNIKSVMTSEQCKTGTDRIHEILRHLKKKPDFIVNLQGDNPLCPPWIVKAVIDVYKKDHSTEVATPCVRLTWKELDTLRNQKKTTPFSGTTAIVNKHLQALWFSKNILPAIRNEEKCKITEPIFSPVLRHIGLYGYRTDILNKIASLEESYYEQYEGLEQLRFLENGIKINVAIVNYKGRESMSGIDSPQDIQRAEQLLNQYGEF